MGIFVQNGSLGLITGITNIESEFLHASPAELSLLVSRMERLRQHVGAEQKTFAGILPGVLQSRGLLAETPETETTVTMVSRAAQLVLEQEGYSSDTPIVLLGAKGHVGRHLAARWNGRSLFPIDVDSSPEAWPHHLHGQPMLVVNVTKKSAVAQYIPLFWPGCVLLNETYPEPTADELAQIKAIGATALLS